MSACLSLLCLRFSRSVSLVRQESSSLFDVVSSLALSPLHNCPFVISSGKKVSNMYAKRSMSKRQLSRMSKRQSYQEECRKDKRKLPRGLRRGVERGKACRYERYEYFGVWLPGKTADWLGNTTFKLIIQWRQRDKEKELKQNIISWLMQWYPMTGFTIWWKSTVYGVILVLVKNDWAGLDCNIHHDSSVERGVRVKREWEEAVNMDMKGMIQLVIQMIELDNNN